KPIGPEFLDPIAVQRRGPRSELAPRIAAKVGDRHMAEIDLYESHGLPLVGRFGDMVRLIYEDGHPLLPSTMRVDSSTTLTRALDLDAVLACPNSILRISALHDQVGMPVEVAVFDKGPGVLRHASRQHIGHHA